VLLREILYSAAKEKISKWSHLKAEALKNKKSKHKMQYGRSSKNKPPQLNPLIETNVETALNWSVNFLDLITTISI
jgi:hypothetical protein